MGWADKYIEELKKKNVVDFSIFGGEFTLVPVAPETKLSVGDSVLCIVDGEQVFSVITYLEKGKFRIANKAGKKDSLVAKEDIYGKCVYESNQ